MNRSYLAENKELAYTVWRECGQNVEKTLRELRRRDDGFPVSKPTLYTWKEEGGWEGRAARAEEIERKGRDARLSAEERALLSLEAVQGQYEAYFKTLGATKVDNQAMFAYTGVVKSIVEIKQKAAGYKAALFIAFLRDLIDFFSKHDETGVRTIEANFDDLASYAKEKYGA